MSLLWRPLLVGFAVLAAMVVILILIFSDGDDEPYVTPPVKTPTSTISQEELEGRPAKTENPDAKPVAGKDLEVGDCLANATATTTIVTTFDTVDCDEAHDGEVFSIIKLEDADKYPGTKFVSGKGQRGCRARLRRQATAKAFADRRLGYKFVYPTRQSWAQGDREVTCLATFRKPRKTKLQQRRGADDS